MCGTSEQCCKALAHEIQAWELSTKVHMHFPETSLRRGIKLLDNNVCLCSGEAEQCASTTTHSAAAGALVHCGPAAGGSYLQQGHAVPAAARHQVRHL